MNRTVLKSAIDTTQRAQRNYDLSKSVPLTDLDTLIHAAVNSPSKQNETHYALHVYTDTDIIKKVYDCTKKFTLASQTDKTNYGVDNDGVFWQNDTLSVKNSQILANALFVYEEDLGPARGYTHQAGQESLGNASILYKEQIAYSIGISVGELILSASLLGYKTGICSAMDDLAIKKVLGTTNVPKLLVGIGYDNPGTDRRQHAEVLNKDVPENNRTGEMNEKWKFPSFEKSIKVKINGN